MTTDGGRQARIALAIGAAVILGLSFVPARPGGSIALTSARSGAAIDVRRADSATAAADTRDQARHKGHPGRSRRDATAAGRRFLTAFLTYEVDPGRHELPAALRATSNAQLRERLIASPSRITYGIPREPGRLVHLRAGDDAVGEAVPLLATVRRGRRTTELVLVMERKDGRWLAARLGD